MVVEPDGPRYIAVRNWHKFQHFKKPKPPWIKFYGRELFTNYEWTKLTLFDRGLLACCWGLVQSRGKWLPNDPPWIRERIGTVLTASRKLGHSREVRDIAAGLLRLVDAEFLYYSPVDDCEELVAGKRGPSPALFTREHSDRMRRLAQASYDRLFKGQPQ